MLLSGKQQVVLGEMVQHVQCNARWASRCCAVLTALWLVACGVLGLRHHAQVGHIPDLHANAVHHAPQLTGHHNTGAVPDVHGRRDAGGDDGACALASSHEVGVPLLLPIAVTTELSSTGTAACGTSRLARSSSRILRIAPKTSPPIV
ncbi:MAG: hypothetical protein H7138_12085 [Myxococcales bacterium]|nr:hypothetical protein [Myxococcales bacterium]